MTRIQLISLFSIVSSLAPIAPRAADAPPMDLILDVQTSRHGRRVTTYRFRSQPTTFGYGVQALRNGASYFNTLGRQYTAGHTYPFVGDQHQVVVGAHISQRSAEYIEIDFSLPRSFTTRAGGDLDTGNDYRRLRVKFSQTETTVVHSGTESPIRTIRVRGRTTEDFFGSGSGEFSEIQLDNQSIPFSALH